MASTREPVDRRATASASCRGAATTGSPTSLAGAGAQPTPGLAAASSELAARGYGAVLTAALAPPEPGAVPRAGFEVHERLHLLRRDLRDLARRPPATVDLRRGRRRDRPRRPRGRRRRLPRVLAARRAGLDDAADGHAAAPRFRVADPTARTASSATPSPAGPGARGYLQRLAVDPAAQRADGAALVADGLRWLRRWGAREVLVNTQEANGVPESASAVVAPVDATPRNNAAAIPSAPSPGTDADLAQRAADGLLVNGSVNNGAASPFAQLAAFGNNRRGIRSLYNGGLGIILGNSAFDARSFSFDNTQNTPKPIYSDAQFAGTFGGPIRIPGLVSRPNVFALFNTRPITRRTPRPPACRRRSSAAAISPARATPSGTPSKFVIQRPVCRSPAA